MSETRRRPLPHPQPRPPWAFSGEGGTRALPRTVQTRGRAHPGCLPLAGALPWNEGESPRPGRAGVGFRGSPHGRKARPPPPGAGGAAGARRGSAGLRGWRRRGRARSSARSRRGRGARPGGRGGGRRSLTGPAAASPPFLSPPSAWPSSSSPSPERITRPPLTLVAGPSSEFILHVT